MLETKKQRLLARTALLLALTILFQSLRLFVPIPPLFSTFFIGTLVNACLLVAAETLGIWPAVVIGSAAPVVAWFQQLLPVPVFIIPIAAANGAYTVIYSKLLARNRWLSLFAAAIIKTLLLYGSIQVLVSFIAIPAKVAAGILFVMSWPQLVTAVLGGIAAFYVVRRIKSVL